MIRQRRISSCDRRTEEQPLLANRSLAGESEDHLTYFLLSSAYCLLGTTVAFLAYYSRERWTMSILYL